MDASRFDRLTKRHRECLRGVRGLKGSKEIADSLGIEKSTVDSYLTEAVRLLGAKNRRDAALQLADHEAALSVDASAQTGPDKIGGDSIGLSISPPIPSLPASPDELFVGQRHSGSDRPSEPRRFAIGLPYRRKGQAGNDLSVGERLIWIQLLVLGMAVGFGMLASGLQVLTAMIERMARLLS